MIQVCSSVYSMMQMAKPSRSIKFWRPETGRCHCPAVIPIRLFPRREIKEITLHHGQ